MQNVITILRGFFFSPISLDTEEIIIIRLFVRATTSEFSYGESAYKVTSFLGCGVTKTKFYILISIFRKDSNFDDRT